MIDYEKLQYALGLAKAWADKNTYGCDIIITQEAGEETPAFKLDNTGDEGLDGWYTDNIDNLIAKLQSLLAEQKPEPKYEMEQVVWRIIEQTEICELIIRDCRWCDSYQGYIYHDYAEEDLYPSRESLIESQVDYWLGMLDMPKQIRYFAKQAKSVDENKQECNHESDGAVHYKTVLGWVHFRDIVGNYSDTKLKCKHCGEFYR